MRKIISPRILPKTTFKQLLRFLLFPFLILQIQILEKFVESEFYSLDIWLNEDFTEKFFSL